MLKLFIGGNSQGHNDLAIKAYNGIIADGKEDSIESIENADVIVNYHEFVRKIMENGKTLWTFLKILMQRLFPAMK